MNQSDETPVQVLHYAGEKDNPAVRRAKSYMWVHRSGEFYTDRPVILYEYNKSRGADVPIAYYKGYTIESDALQQYHILENRSPGITSANCWAHGRRSFADAIKAIGKTNEEAIKQSVAYKALTFIAAIYHIEGTLKELTPQERHRQRQEHVKPLVDAFFAWAKQEAETDARPFRKGRHAQVLITASIRKNTSVFFWMMERSRSTIRQPREQSARLQSAGKTGCSLIPNVMPKRVPGSILLSRPPRRIT